MDALTLKGDEGRGLAAIRFGEVLCNLRSEDFRMGKPHQVNLDDSLLKRWRKLTSGSETSQYREEKKTIVIPLVAASETGEAQTQPQYHEAIFRCVILGMGVVRLRRIEICRVKNCRVRGILWKEEP